MKLSQSSFKSSIFVYLATEIRRYQLKGRLYQTALFHFSSKRSKIMLWLNYLEFDRVNRCFKKLDLNQSDSITFIKRITLFKISLDCIICSLLPLFEIANFVCLFMYKSNFYFNYIISIILICPSAYLAINCLFCLLIVLYQVNDWPFIINNL